MDTIAGSGARRRSPVIIALVILGIVGALMLAGACGTNTHTPEEMSAPLATEPATATADAEETTAPAVTESTTATVVSDDDQLALETLDAIVQGDFESATARFDDVLHQNLPADMLESSWSTYQEQFGSYQSHADPQDTARGQITVVSVPLQMEYAPGEFRVSFDQDQKIAGLYFLEAGVPIP
ncbi:MULTISPECIES: DUF3887 domain-containing protein [unclassified Rhodococcus (in: high G+C Gram-positive bacteria)]|uniref:DUF3887 domain-containing protein n=1 Tax=unclassified Rhodococcus (in: high G+C Gram-positive bacteria) TaxID=192944 RepID=UPI0016397784|nr:MULTISPECIES: DUF3887 domain-containing protein [unclassified Rhodococcus (in: high G+C Gram-positive bacteria)]MBC2644550.1 DUF3887 domain-containing protein [Rhodococcus sp. 3A]MBC2897761.1 DUF3887 domain-containing protein [Rhodococcus sp. 4CII]